MNTVVPPSHRIRAGDNPLQAEMRRIVESIYGPTVRRLPGLDIGRSYLNATNEEFRYGGDLVDVFHYGQGLTSVAIVDITGHGSCEAEQQALALTRYAYEYAGEQLRDDVAALVVKVETERAA